MAGTDPGIKPSVTNKPPTATTDTTGATGMATTANKDNWTWVTNTKTYYKPNEFTAGHQAIDIEATLGSPVYAPTGAKVVYAGTAQGINATPNGGFGTMITLLTQDGYYTTFGHLSKLNVKTGQTVTQGQLIGLTGSTGNSTGPHLHFQIMDSKGLHYNPLTWFSSTFNGTAPISAGQITNPPSNNITTTSTGTTSTASTTTTPTSTTLITDAATGNAPDLLGYLAQQAGNKISTASSSAASSAGNVIGEVIKGGAKQLFGANYVTNLIGLLLGVILVVVGLWGVINSETVKTAMSDVKSIVGSVAEAGAMAGA